MLCILYADLVNARGKRDVSHLRMHVSRQCSADHKLVVNPDVKTIVTSAVQFEKGRLV